MWSLPQDLVAAGTRRINGVAQDASRNPIGGYGRPGVSYHFLERRARGRWYSNARTRCLRLSRSLLPRDLWVQPCLLPLHRQPTPSNATSAVPLHDNASPILSVFRARNRNVIDKISRATNISGTRKERAIAFPIGRLAFWFD